MYVMYVKNFKIHEQSQVLYLCIIYFAQLQHKFKKKERERDCVYPLIAMQEPLLTDRDQRIEVYNIYI